MDKKEIRKHVDNITDIMAEKDRDFHQLCITIGKARLDKLHYVMTNYIAYNICGVEIPSMREKATDS